jgi:hypothetical protein
MNNIPACPEYPWLTYSEVKLKIESCYGPGKGKYTLSLWTQGTEPLLPKRFIPGRTKAVYSRERVDMLLKPKSAPAQLSRP